MKEPPIHPMQAMIDGWGAAWQKERAATQMTLGGFIAALEKLPEAAPINGLGDLDSYRGYYCDLAFEPADRVESAGALLARCREAMGRTFTGYKGGDYLMGDTTPLWIAPYGGSGIRLMGLDTESVPHLPIGKSEDA